MKISSDQFKIFLFQHEKSMKNLLHKTGYSADTIRRMCSGKYPVSEKTILKIAKTYPDIVEYFPDETLKAMILEQSSTYGYNKSEKALLATKLKQWYKEGDKYVDKLHEILLRDKT